MTSIAMKRAGLGVAIAALIGAGACSKKSQPADAGLQADLAAAGGGSNSDLQLAPSASKSQVVVSAIEGGPQSAPAKSAPARIARPSVRPQTRVAQHQAPAQAPSVQAQDPTPAPVERAAVMQAPAPAPAPAPAQQRDTRVYKSEGEVFRQMPWIKP